MPRAQSRSELRSKSPALPTGRSLESGRKATSLICCFLTCEGGTGRPHPGGTVGVTRDPGGAGRHAWLRVHSLPTSPFSTVVTLPSPGPSCVPHIPMAQEHFWAWFSDSGCQQAGSGHGRREKGLLRPPREHLAPRVVEPVSPPHLPRYHGQHQLPDAR